MAQRHPLPPDPIHTPGTRSRGSHPGNGQRPDLLLLMSWVLILVGGLVTSLWALAAALG